MEPSPAYLALFTQWHNSSVCAAVVSACYSSVLILCSHLQGAIPEDWGASGSLPNLQKLALSFNFELSGQLPAQWGSDGSSLQNLTSVEITNCDLSGPLPPSWAGNLPSLTKLNVSANALSGAPALSRSCSNTSCWTPLLCMWQRKGLHRLQMLICLYASAQGCPLP